MVIYSGVNLLQWAMPPAKCTQVGSGLLETPTLFWSHGLNCWFRRQSITTPGVMEPVVCFVRLLKLFSWSSLTKRALKSCSELVMLMRYCQTLHCSFCFRSGLKDVRWNVFRYHLHTYPQKHKILGNNRRGGKKKKKRTIFSQEVCQSHERCFNAYKKVGLTRSPLRTLR